ncbi:MAG: alpha/beta hydrolase family protein [Lysobacterales bacterium]
MLSRIGTLSLSALLYLLPAIAAADVSMEDVQGAWLGSMQVPDGPKLRVGVEIFRKADGSWGGNLASPDQGVRYMPVGSVSLSADLLRVELAGAPLHISGRVDRDARRIDGEFVQGGSSFELHLAPVAALPETDRPQTPKGKLPYRQDEVRIHNSRDEIWLAGTLTSPDDDLKHPAVLLLAGSGPSHRDAYSAGHRPFQVLADDLSRRGYVVLRADKRGVYKSGGTYDGAETADFARDAEAAIRFLKQHPSVNPSKIGLIGHSEGSLVAAMAAVSEPVQTIVLMAGPGLSVHEVLLVQDQTEPAAKGASAAEVEVLLDFSQRFYQTALEAPNSAERKARLQALYDTLPETQAAIVNRWNDRSGTLNVDYAARDSFVDFLKNDPTEYWQQLKTPVLVLNGGKDVQVSAEENVSAIVEALAQQKGPIESQIFPDLNHMFQSAKTGGTDEYGEISETLNPALLTRVHGWLERTLAP